jgi:hypothetical protein
MDADGDLVTGATGLDSEVSKDGGTFADATSEATEIATASGLYYLDLTSTEMNADTVAIIVKTSSSGAKTTVMVCYPEEVGDIRVNVTAAAGTAWASGAITAASIASDAITSAKIATGAITAAKFAADAITSTVIADSAITANKIASAAITSAKFAAGALDAVWSVATRLLTAGTNIVLAKGVGVTGFTDVSASDIRTAVGLASANLDTQLAQVTAIKTKTDSLGFTVSGQVDANIQYVNDVAVTGNGQSGTEWGP